MLAVHHHLALLGSEPEVVGVFGQRLVQNPLWTHQLFPEVEGVVLRHGVLEGQVLACGLQGEGASHRILSEGVHQNHRLLAVRVVEVLVQPGARVELTQVVGQTIAVGVHEVICEAVVQNRTGVVHLTWGVGATHEPTVLRCGRPSVVVTSRLGDVADGGVESVAAVHLHRHLFAQEGSV